MKEMDENDELRSFCGECESKVKPSRGERKPKRKLVAEPQVVAARLTSRAEKKKRRVMPKKEHLYAPEIPETLQINRQLAKSCIAYRYAVETGGTDTLTELQWMSAITAVGLAGDLRCSLQMIKAMRAHALAFDLHGASGVCAWFFPYMQPHIADRLYAEGCRLRRDGEVCGLCKVHDDDSDEQEEFKPVKKRPVKRRLSFNIHVNNGHECK
jgi:hypothetical protein